jgi:hypothetical protein
MTRVLVMLRISDSFVRASNCYSCMELSFVGSCLYAIGEYQAKANMRYEGIYRLFGVASALFGLLLERGYRYLGIFRWRWRRYSVAFVQKAALYFFTGE